MRAMVLDAPGLPLARGDLPEPGPAAGPGAAPSARLRGLPHRPARRRRRAGAAEAAARPRAPDRRRGAGSARTASCRAPGRRSLARLDLRHLPLLPCGAENLCDAARSRATTSTAASPSSRGGRALLLPAARRLPRSSGRPPPLRRPHRVPLPPDAATATAGDLRVRRRRAHRRPGRPPRGPRVFALPGRGTRRRRSSRWRRARWAGGADERPPEELDAAILFAPGGELVPARSRRAQGRLVVCGGST